MASQNPDEAPKRLSSDESLWGEQESKRKRGGPAFGVRVDQLPQDEPGGTLTAPTAPFPDPRRRWRLRRVDLLIGAAALVLLLVGFLLGLAVRPARPPPPPAGAPVTVTSLATRQAPPPRACLVAMERADAAIAYLVGNVRDQRLSDTIQEFVESRRACQAAMR